MSNKNVVTLQIHIEIHIHTITPPIHEDPAPKRIISGSTRKVIHSIDDVMDNQGYRYTHVELLDSKLIPAEDQFMPFPECLYNIVHQRNMFLQS